jgi:quercetin dioxygenase-like cupin family protein
LLAVALAAQTTAEVELTAEPHHRLALENSYVRAFKVEVPPGQATLMHVHHHDYVYVVLGPAEISNQVEGKPAVQIKLQDGETHALDGGFAHIARDVGSTPFRNITIELLQDEQARKSPPPKWDEDRGLQILDGGTKDIMFVKDGVRVSETELRPGGMIPKHHHAGPHLVVAVTDLTLRSDVVGKGVSTIELKAGDIKWSPGGFAHTLMNVGKQQAKFVTVEFH